MEWRAPRHWDDFSPTGKHGDVILSGVNGKEGETGTVADWAWLGGWVNGQWYNGSSVGDYH